MVMGEAVKAVASFVVLSIMRTSVQLKMERQERQPKGVGMLVHVVVVAVVVAIMERLLMGSALVEYLSATVELAMGKRLFFKSSYYTPLL